MKKDQREELRLQRLILDYEIRSSWWAAHISIRWMQAMAAVYLARKAKRKYARWMRSLGMKQVVEQYKGHGEDSKT